MTFKERKALARELSLPVLAGQPWSSWREAAAERKLYDKEIDRLAPDVLFYVEDEHTQAFQDALLAGDAPANPGLDEEVYHRVLKSQTEKARRDMVREMTSALMHGEVKYDQLEQQYPQRFLSADDYNAAKRRSRGKSEEVDEDELQGMLIRGGIFTGIGLLLMYVYGGFSGWISFGYGVYCLFTYFNER